MAQPTFRDFRATVAAVRRVSPSFVRVTLRDPDLCRFGDTCLDQRIKLVFPLETGPDAQPDADPFASFPTGDTWYLEWREMPEDRRNTFRTYTPSAVRRSEGEVDVDVAVHGDTGPGSRWALGVQVGDPVMLWGPDAEVPGHEAAGVDWTPGTAERFLLAGDETALPAIVNVLRVLDPLATGQAFLEVPSADDVRPVIAPTGVDVVWLPRDAGQAPGERLVAELPARLTVEPRAPGVAADAHASDAPDVTDEAEAVPWELAEVTGAGQAYAWLAAESGTVKALRRHLVRERGWDRRQVAFMGYWKQGVSQV